MIVLLHDRVRLGRAGDERVDEGRFGGTLTRHFFRLLGPVTGLSGSMLPSAPPRLLVPRVTRPLRLEPALPGTLGAAVDVAPVAATANHDQGVTPSAVELPRAIGCPGAVNGASPRPRQKLDVVAPVGKLPLTTCPPPFRRRLEGWVL